MLAPGEPFPSEGGVPSGDVSPGTNANVQSSSTQSSAAYPSHTPGASSHKLSTGAIVGIVIGGVVVAVLVGALFFLLGRQKTMLQFMRRNQYQAPGAHNPPGDQPDVGSPPPPQMTSFAAASGTPYSETPNYHEPAYDTPPYKRHASQDPLAALQPPVAELPSPGEKHVQEYLSPHPTEMEQHPQESYQGSRVPTPQQPAQPLGFWGRSRSTKTLYVTYVLRKQQVLIIGRTSELSAESPPPGRSPNMSPSRYQADR